jgi:hypothetical protein
MVKITKPDSKRFGQEGWVEEVEVAKKSGKDLLTVYFPNEHESDTYYTSSVELVAENQPCPEEFGEDDYYDEYDNEEDGGG